MASGSLAALSEYEATLTKREWEVFHEAFEKARATMNVAESLEIGRAAVETHKRKKRRRAP